MDLFSKVVSWENLLDAYHKTRKGKLKYKIAAVKFQQDAITNLKILQKSLMDGTYHPKEYTSFEVYEPKRRKVYAPKYIDKIVQHALNNVLCDFYEPKFIHDSYACIRKKGTHRAILNIQKHSRVCKRNHGDAFIGKTDIAKFFYSIDREVLKGVLSKKLKCSRTYDLCITLIENSPDNKGLPLGNLTSQLFANVLLNEVDQYSKRHLKIKHYTRYADDIFIVTKSSHETKELISKVRTYLLQTLKLFTLDHKTSVVQSMRGCVGLGMKIYPTHILILNRHKKSFHKIKNKPMSLNSWISFASIANIYNFTRSHYDQIHK